MLLYDNVDSGNCYKVRLVLARLGIDYERREVSVEDRSGRQELLGGKNPALRVPVLQLDDGRHLAESNAIIWYLAEDTELVPDDRFERAQVLQWLFFEQYDHEPNVAVARFLQRHRPDDESLGDKLEACREGGHQAIGAMDRHLRGRDFLVADRFTLAEVALYAYTHVAEEGGIGLDAYPAVRGWLARVAGQPGHVPMAETVRPAD